MAVWAIDKQFPKFLLDNLFQIQTDQISLTTFLSKSSSRASQRIQRWMEKWRKYDFTAIHIPGKNNVIADFLSRIHYKDFDEILMNSDDFMLDDDDSGMIICSVARIPLQDFIDGINHDFDLQYVICINKKGWPKSKVSVPKDI